MNNLFSHKGKIIIATDEAVELVELASLFSEFDEEKMKKLIAAALVHAQKSSNEVKQNE